MIRDKLNVDLVQWITFPQADLWASIQHFKNVIWYLKLAFGGHCPNGEKSFWLQFVLKTSPNTLYFSDYLLLQYLLQGASQWVSVLLVDPIPLQTGKHFQLLIGPQGQQVDDAIPKGTLEYRVIGKALTNSVGWVDRCGALALWDHLWSRQRRLTDMDLLS